MKCPYCLVSFHPEENPPYFIDAEVPNEGQESYLWTYSETCPNCKKVIVWLTVSSETGWKDEGVRRHEIPKGRIAHQLVRPKTTGRQPVPSEVPEEFARDYREACLILADSPNASAALSRRCLQHILREKAGVKRARLIDEVREVINSGGLPSSVSGVIDVVRRAGNAAAHPLENDAGLVVPVEPWQAEWCLEVIEELFDFYFVTPARNAERLKRFGL